jgi:hypothetical protein
MQTMEMYMLSVVYRCTPTLSGTWFRSLNQCGRLRGKYVLYVYILGLLLWVFVQAHALGHMDSIGRSLL